MLPPNSKDQNMVVLYNHGDETEINGIKCIVGRFEPMQYQEKISTGWVTDPKELCKIPTFEEVDTNCTGLLSFAEIREAAKVAGIEGWEKGRISRLKRELGYA